MFVINCHIMEQCGYITMGNYFSVGVQIFLFISGWLYSTKKFESADIKIKFVVKNYCKILLDYYVYCSLFALPIYYILKPETITVGSILRVLTCSGTIGGIHHLWYIPYLLFCYLITPALYDVGIGLEVKLWGEKSRKGYFTVLLLMALLVQILMYAFNSYFIAAWIFCYVAGYYFNSILEKLKSNNIVNVVTIIFFLTTILANILKYYFKYYLQINVIGVRLTLFTLLYNYAQAFLGISIIVIVYFALRHVEWKKHRGVMNVLEFTDKYSYDIYLTHMIYVKGVLSVIGITKSFGLNVFMAIFLSLVSGTILHIICCILRNINQKKWEKRNEKKQIY
ncbi:hypothetical protein psyc5s11_50780 [Clostridium gelidum]|uniref:Acyltransferase 3 domain-containing protein n=1 Tax=Clostridium gelidum TaxID=704125 RepID=A0ABM7TAL7_9CLOT|nr:hypothetical protein psyc5s11_50780 [Clostridium gelidum]